VVIHYNRAQMKTTGLMLSFVAAGALALAGCGKPVEQGPQPLVIKDVKVDVPALQQTFSSATPELQGTASSAAEAIRYGQFPQALMKLDQLANDASLTEPQKKVVNQVIGQVKQLVNKTEAKPAQ